MRTGAVTRRTFVGTSLAAGAVLSAGRAAAASDRAAIYKQIEHRAAAKLDLRLVPDMTHQGAVEKLKAHLAKHGFGDIEVNVTGGYDPTTTSVDARLIKAESQVYVLPASSRSSGHAAAAHGRATYSRRSAEARGRTFWLGHGLRAHAPDEYFLIESQHPKLAGLDGAVKSYADFVCDRVTVDTPISARRVASGA